MAEIWDLSTTDASNNDASFGFPENMAPSSVNDNLRRVLGALARWYGDTNGTLVTAGTGSAYTIAAPNRSWTTSYSDGAVMMFQAHTVCSSGATLAVDGKTAKAIMKSASKTVSASDIIANQIVMVAYESSLDKWQMISPIAKGWGLRFNAEVDATNGGADDLTAIDFTSIPSGTSTIQINLAALNRSGTSILKCQIGDSGGIETSGYTGDIATSAGTVSALTSGFDLGIGDAANTGYSGTIFLQRARSAGTTWAMSGVISAGGVDVYSTAGYKTLSAELDRVRITMANGTDTFDFGIANITYE